jgi:hypothetical protein
MLWYGAATTSGAAARVEGNPTSMNPDQDVKIDFIAPATLRNGHQSTRSVSALPWARVLTLSSRALSMSAFGSLCRSRYRSIICMKFTPRRSLIW